MANLICTYNVTSTTDATKICYYTDSFSDILIDGTSIGLEYDYRFSSTGEHTVEFVLADVTTIGINAFRSCYSLKEIIIPDSVTTIGGYSFYDCENLTGVTIPNSVTNIGNYAFAYCRSLTSVTIPDTVTRIGIGAFVDCSSLTGVTIGSGVTTIEASAFVDCSSLTSITIPDSVTTIGFDAFAYCTSLTSITCKATTAPELGNRYVFMDVATGGTLYYPEGSDYSTWLSTDECYLGYYSWNGIATGGTENPDTGGTGNPDTGGTENPDTGGTENPDTGGTENPDTGGTENPDTGGTENPDTGYTGEYIVYGKYDITDTGSTRICYVTEGLEDIRIDGVSIFDDVWTTSNYYAYEFNSTGEYVLEFVYSSSVIPYRAFYAPNDELDSLIGVSIGRGITEIGGSAFYGCRYIESLEIPDSVTTIGASAFAFCKNIAEINIPDSVTSIGERAFSNCNYATKLKLSNSLTSIPTRAFYECYSLKEINIPDSVTSIGERAFYRCYGATAIDTGKNVTSIGNSAFSGCSALTSVIFGKYVESIGEDAFSNCSVLTSITLPPTLKTVGEDAFSSCRSLNEITIMAKTAPDITYLTFYGVKEYGTLYYPTGSDYSTWLSTDNYYLGYYYWNAVEGDFTKGKIFLEYDSKDFDGYAISTSIDVTYQDIITVNPPTVSADWINLTTMATVSDVERYYFSLKRNEGDDRQGTITFSGYDEDNYLITKALTITQDNFEDKMATSIALRKTSLDFPYEGSTLYMQVDYINPSEILAPLPAQEWITVEENQRGTATSGNDTIIQVQYRVTMNETSFSRQASITFRCTDAAGNILTDSHFMCYQAAPPTAEMTFNPTVLNFPYTGGTDVVEVTCKQPNSGGLTIETSSDYITGFRTTDTYEGSDGYTIYTVEVTVGNENTGTTNLNEVLEFSYTDIFDSYIKVDYPVVIGYAGEGTVHAFTQTAEVNADGSPEYSSFTSINCGYSGVTIHTPVVEGDWIILGEGEKQTGTFYGYDTVMNYPISFSANEGGARIGTITFSGTDGLGNTKTDVCTITQLAFEGGGEEDPDTPDIPSDSTEVYYGSIWKDVEYDFGGSENVTYTISTIEERWYPHIGVIEEETVIYKGTAWKSPDREGLSVIINKICQNYFGESRLPLGSAVGVTQNYKKFILRGEFGNILRTYHFVNDWSYQDLKMGLKTNPIIPYIVEGQYCFFSTLSFGEMDVPWGMDYFDGQPSYRNVEMLEDEFTTNIIADSRRQGISRFWFGSRYYDYVPKCKSHYVLYYLNPYGGWDWFPIMGNVKRTDNLTSYTYTQNYNNTTLDFGTSKYLNEIKIRYVLNTGWIKEYQADRMWELIESNKVYLHDTKTDEIYPVVITDKDVEWKRKTPTNKIVSYDINIELSQTRERL